MVVPWKISLMLVQMLVLMLLASRTIE